ncbi:uncharacterized protein PADG_01287 [Paracoccidioides brasiliensis Pb18]|uniref:Domain of unknown function at the cortex 1 domain-containing protein n=2 Tax=Paracoccidioides brasiliensis TaxID=121759 RepID=C1G2X1_PARBD|nr:uncharacterized protein PADG_01287 [Paracoccidioides brasiliensis Pb18]EEH45137.1 hypothetical protein PADG_01287 [Paracoccidioides brasiliensis Pb18]ODH25990.1 hypothetical protein ACO22_04880 [Paracoccidioides brasiliensis]ODH47876.1 hypothetical protein GX48_05995 [Paracoccidioides brasiliensis]
MSNKTPAYILSVTAGPTYNSSTHNPVIVNSPVAHLIETEHATIDLRVRIQDFTGLPRTSPRTSPYFSHPIHRNDQYSIAISLVPKHAVRGTDLVFGNDFDHPIRHNLPPGTNKALKIVKWTIDPGLEGDAYADRPYLYGPALSSWNFLRICDVGEGRNLKVEEEVIQEGGEGGGEEVRRKLDIPDDAVRRRKFFLDKANRERFVFEEGRLYKADFGNGYLGFNDFSLRLPGFSIKVTKYINVKNHQLRYVLKNKRTGDVYFVVLFTLLLDGDGREWEGEEIGVADDGGSGDDVDNGDDDDDSDDVDNDDDDDDGGGNKDKYIDNDEGVD